MSQPLSTWMREQQRARSRARARERLAEARRIALAPAAEAFNIAFDEAAASSVVPDAPPAPPVQRPRALYRLCLAGREPAESLPAGERGRLVRELHSLRWTDQQIADHTRMTLYTTARIRARLELSPNETGRGGYLMYHERRVRP